MKRFLHLPATVRDLIAELFQHATFYLKRAKRSYAWAEPIVVWYPSHRWRHGTFQDRSGLTGLIGADRSRPRNEHPYS